MIVTVCKIMQKAFSKTGVHSILYCILTSGRISESPFGEERFTLSLGRWLVKHNLNVVIIGSTFTGIKTKFLSKDETDHNKKNNGKKIRVLILPHAIYMLSRLFFSALYFFKIFSINKKSPIKLIHAQDTGYSALAAIIAGKIMKIPVVLSSHGIRHKNIESVLTGRFRKILLKFEYDLDIFTIKNANSLIAINPDIKMYYEKIIGKTVEFIPNSIKIKNFEFSSTARSLIRKDLGIDDQTKLVGYIGRLSPEKNLITLLNSFTKVIRDNSFVRLIIVGSGPQEFLLREEARKHHIEDKVIFYGLRNDVTKILSALDIFVLPSYGEGLSSALLEAMSCGRAIICSDISGNRLLITHNKEGLLICPDKTEEISDAIQLLVTNDSLRSRLGTNAKIKANEYDEDVVFPKILDHYSVIIKKIGK